MTFELYVGGPKGSGDVVFETDSLDDLSINRNHTAKSDFSSSLRFETILSDILSDEVWIYHDDEVIFRGFLEELSRDFEGNANISGRDFLAELESVVDTISLEGDGETEEIERFWSENTDYSVDVLRRPPINFTSRDATTQSELEDIYEHPSGESDMFRNPYVPFDEYPISFEDGFIQVYETGTSPRLPLDSGGLETFGDVEFDELNADDGTAWEIKGGGSVQVTKDISFFRENEEHYKPENLEIWMHLVTVSPQDEVDISVNGVSITDAFGNQDPVSNGWYPIFPEDFKSGENKNQSFWSATKPDAEDWGDTVTFTISNNRSDSFGFTFSGLYIGDMNMHRQGEDWTDGASYPDAPGRIPQELEVHLEPKETDLPVGDITMSADMTFGGEFVPEFQEEKTIGIRTVTSVDGGNSWNVKGGEPLGEIDSAPISQTHEYDAPSDTDVRYVFMPTLTSWDESAPAIWQLRSLNEVTDERAFQNAPTKEITDSIIDVAQEIHETLGYRFVVSDYENKELISFHKSQVEEEPEYKITDFSKSRDVSGYYNRIIGTSSEFSDVTVDDETEQLVFDGVREQVKRFPDVESEEELESKARSVLDDAVQQRGDSGSLEAVPSFVEPGFRYPVGVFNRIFVDADNIGRNALRFTGDSDEFVSYELGSTFEQSQRVEYNGMSVEILVRLPRSELRDGAGKSYIISSESAKEFLVVEEDGSVSVELPTNEQISTGAGVIHPNTAHRISVTVDINNRIQIYVDGKLEAGDD